MTTQEQAEATVEYLEIQGKKMSRIDRGKLRGAICTSLYRIFGSIMGKDGEAQVYWAAFKNRFGMLAKRYADAFASIYSTIARWAKKAKHALPCWQLMARMTCLGNTEFYLDRKRDAILPVLLKTVKESKSLKSECYEFVLEYLRELPIELCRTDMEGFVPEAKKLLAISFPKRKDADFAEEAKLIEAVTSIGRLNANFAFAELQGMLASKDTTVTQKALLCHALGTLARESPREVYNYNAHLGPLMYAYMESEYEQLAVNAIRSFPHVTVPDPNQEKNIVQKVAKVCVTEKKPEVAETAFASLRDYCMQRADIMLPPLATMLLEEISLRAFSRGEHSDYSEVKAGFAFLHRLLLIYLGQLETSGKSSSINAIDWIQTREQAEGVTAMWLVHTDASVRSAAMEVLRTFSHPVFVALEEHRVPGIVRLHSVLPIEDDNDSSVWSPHMARLCSLTPPSEQLNEAPAPATALPPGKAPPPDERGVLLSERFRYALEYAWVRLVQRFSGALEVLPTLESEKVGLWLNYSKFLCLSVPYPTDGPYSAGDEGMVDRVAPGLLEQFWAALLRVAWADGVPSGIRTALLSYLEQIHVTCIPHAVTVIKALRDTPPPAVVNTRRAVLRRGKPSGRRSLQTAAQEVADDDGLAASGWIFHEEVLELLSRFVTRLTTNQKSINAAALALQPSNKALAEQPALPNALIQTLQYCVAAWIQDFERFGPETCRRLSLGTRFSGMRMVKVYLDPAAGAMGGYVDVPPANRMLQWLLAWTPPPRRVYVEAAYRHVPDFVAQLLEGAEAEEYANAMAGQAPNGAAMAEDPLRFSLEIAVVEALEAMLMLGPLTSGGGEAACRVALHFLQMMALRGPHLRKPVEKALAAFLRSNPTFVSTYFKLAVVEYCFEQLGLTMAAAELLASMQLAAMVTCWCENLDEWIGRHGVPLPRMMLVCLLHQCSPDAASRASAIELASALARNPTEPLDAGPALPAAEFVTLSSCVATTYRYSQVLAVHYSARMGEPLLRELVATARLLPDVQNESMLHMILPWIAHFGTDFSDELIAEWKDVWWAFLSHLLQLSHQCHERANSSFLFFTLEACWTAVLQGKQSNALCQLTMDFLVGTHAEATARAAAAETPRFGEDGRVRASSNATNAGLDEPDPRKDADAASLIRHLTTRIVLFIGQSGRADAMLTQLIDALPPYGAEEPPPAIDAQQLLDHLAAKAQNGEAASNEMLAMATNGRQPSTFLLASELLLAHVEELSHRVPLLLNLALVHFGPHSPMPIGGAFVAKLLAKLTSLSKEERTPIESPPADPDGRAKLVAALCEGAADDPKKAANEMSLREGWAAVSLSWALAVPDEGSAAQSLEWFEVLTRHRALAYAEVHRLVGFLAASVEANRHEVSMGILKTLREHTKRLNALPYLNGVLLCVAAVLGCNARHVEMFSLSLSLLRSTLDRNPAGGTTELSSMLLVLRPPPPKPDGNPWRTLSEQQQIAQSNYDPNPGWKSKLLQEALDAQLGLWDVKGLPLSADELLRMLLLRGGSLRASKDDTIWLISELRAIYQPHLPNCDEMGLSHLWLLMLQACSAPRTPDADAACEQAVAWLTVRGGSLEHLRGAFEELHSSSAVKGAAYAWAQTGKKEVGEGDDWWHTPLAKYLNIVKGLCMSAEDQQRAFSVMLEACCLWLMLDEPPDAVAEAEAAAALTASVPTNAAEAAVAEANAAAAATAARETAAKQALSQRWAALVMLGSLLHEFRGPWSAEQHAATAELLSSLVFSIKEPTHAAKLRSDMQWLVADPPDGHAAALLFVQPAGDPTDQTSGRKAVGFAAASQSAIARGLFCNHLHLQLLNEEEWVAALRMLTLKLAPTDGVLSLGQRLAQVSLRPPSLPPLPHARMTGIAAQATSTGTAPAAAWAAAAAPSGVPAYAPPPDMASPPGYAPPSPMRNRGLSQVTALAPPNVPGMSRLTRGESISAFCRRRRRLAGAANADNRQQCGRLGWSERQRRERTRAAAAASHPRPAATAARAHLGRSRWWWWGHPDAPRLHRRADNLCAAAAAHPRPRRWTDGRDYAAAAADARLAHEAAERRVDDGSAAAADARGRGAAAAVAANVQGGRPDVLPAHSEADE